MWRTWRTEWTFGGLWCALCKEDSIHLAWLIVHSVVPLGKLASLSSVNAPWGILSAWWKGSCPEADRCPTEFLSKELLDSALRLTYTWIKRNPKWFAKVLLRFPLMTSCGTHPVKNIQASKFKAETVSCSGLEVSLMKLTWACEP